MTAATGAAFSGRLRLRLFGIPSSESGFARRGFAPAAPVVQARLEGIGATFIEGYRAALLHDEAGPLKARLQLIAPELRGFAYEGAGMGLALSDFFTPWRKRWQTFLEGPGADHAYMMHVGLGWAWARLPVSISRRLDRLDPLLRWLAVDGYGFHQGYFRWPRFIDAQERPRLSGYALRAFDQGLGRSLWFVRGANVEQVAATLAGFPSDRQADLWGGVGLACAYAGGVAREEVERLALAAGAHRPRLAQGMAFAAKARERAGNLAPHTELACQAVWHRSAAAAAQLTDQALAGLREEAGVPAYERWRQRIASYAEPPSGSVPRQDA
ncbi:MAG: DUF1702 family protein [Pseudomonadota bacterium]|nr:DUF1702 family protein [Pseudomonadota bacterium]